MARVVGVGCQCAIVTLNYYSNVVEVTRMKEYELSFFLKDGEGQFESLIINTTQVWDLEIVASDLLHKGWPNDMELVLNKNVLESHLGTVPIIVKEIGLETYSTYECLMPKLARFWIMKHILELSYAGVGAIVDGYWRDADGCVRSQDLKGKWPSSIKGKRRKGGDDGDDGNDKGKSSEGEPNETPNMTNLRSSWKAFEKGGSAEEFLNKSASLSAMFEIGGGKYSQVGDDIGTKMGYSAAWDLQALWQSLPGVGRDAKSSQGDGGGSNHNKSDKTRRGRKEKSGKGGDGGDENDDDDDGEEDTDGELDEASNTARKKSVKVRVSPGFGGWDNQKCPYDDLRRSCIDPHFEFEFIKSSGNREFKVTMSVTFSLGSAAGQFDADRFGWFHDYLSVSLECTSDNVASLYDDKILNTSTNTSTMRTMNGTSTAPSSTTKEFRAEVRPPFLMMGRTYSKAKPSASTASSQRESPHEHIRWI